jgi:hypothetical protein
MEREQEAVNSAAQTSTVQEDWIPSGNEWKFQTSDGYLGNAYWRTRGAAMTITRPDGTDLFRKTWSSRQIFPAAWPALLKYLKGQVGEQVAADRALRAQT